MASALGITQDRIRIVHSEPGSTILVFQVGVDNQNDGANLGDIALAKQEAGTLDLGYTVLDIDATVYSATGEAVSTSEAYKKKEIDTAVYVLIAIACVAVVIGVSIFALKAFKMTKAYKEVSNADNCESEYDYEKGKL